MSNVFNKMQSILDLVNLLEEMHINKKNKNNSLTQEKIDEIRKDWYLDKLRRSTIDDFFIISKRKI